MWNARRWLANRSSTSSSVEPNTQVRHLGAVHLRHVRGSEADAGLGDSNHMRCRGPIRPGLETGGTRELREAASVGARSTAFRRCLGVAFTIRPLVVHLPCRDGTLPAGKAHGLPW